MDPSQGGRWREAEPAELAPADLEGTEGYEDEPTGGSHPLAMPSESYVYEPLGAPYAPVTQTMSLPARREEPSEAEEREGESRKLVRRKKAKPKPDYVERAPTDISDKVLWGGGAALIFSGVLSWLELATGVAPPEGLDQYLVALSAIVVGYLKKDRA